MFGDYLVCFNWNVAKEYLRSPHDTDKEYVFIANHNSYMDIPPLVMTFNNL